ncbi:SRPBCC domain-containing protein [Chitinophaga vietnamensis]|uniref:SRPBCC domain-containing protein n=1 Tax=Chitinophaga vietnamensis TaxID=2593957 RepID=UPI001177CDED|nr:SRPBCC domain-containing protein [Chitinophaga vietnamensis]
MDTLTIKAAIQVSKPAATVFEGIVDPAQLSNYFISEGSGRMESGKEVSWKFPEFDERFTIKVLKTEPASLVSFLWGGPEGKQTQVDISLEQQPGNSTLVRVTEGAAENNEAGIKWLMGNTEGWANFLACLKAWLEYDINLRKGAFDFMRKK